MKILLWLTIGQVIGFSRLCLWAPSVEPFGDFTWFATLSSHEGTMPNDPPITLPPAGHWGEPAYSFNRRESLRFMDSINLKYKLLMNNLD